MNNKLECIRVLSFKKNYPELTKDLLKTNLKKYKLLLFAAYYFEVKTGFKVGKQYMTNKKGTSFKYVPFESKEDALEYKDKLIEMIKEIESLCQ